MFSLVNFVSFTFITKCDHVIYPLIWVIYINLVLTQFRMHVIEPMTILYWHGTMYIYRYLKRMQLTERCRDVKVTNY